MGRNIWVINQFAGTPESGWGERHFYIAKQWQKQGYDVTIISGSFNHMFTKVKDVRGFCDMEEYDGIKFCWIKTPSYDPKSVKRFISMLVFAWRTLFLRRYLLNAPDHIIVSSMPVFPILPAWWLKKKYNAQLIFEIRDIWPLSLIQIAGISKYHPLALFIGFFERFGYRRADHVVSLLPSAQGHMEKVAGKPLKFTNIPNGVNEELSAKKPLNPAIADALPKDSELIIGYAGTHSQANALEFLIEAAKNVTVKYNKIHFVLVGDGYKKADLIQQAAGSPNIHFFPKIPKDQVHDLLTHFHVCYIGWRDHKELYANGISANKYFDYMLASKPVLDSNNLIKGPVELSGCGIIVPPESVSQIEQGIIRFYNMGQEEREKIGMKGHDYVLKYHSFKFLAERYIKIFDQA